MKPLTKMATTIYCHATGKRVLVIGAGPGGLSAAIIWQAGPYRWSLRCRNTTGGLLWSGIPDYRLPKKYWSRSWPYWKRVWRFGLNYKVNRMFPTEKQSGNFDAVYLSIGAQVIKQEDLHTTTRFTSLMHSLSLMKIKRNASPFMHKKWWCTAGKLALYLSRIINALEAKLLFISMAIKKWCLHMTTKQMMHWQKVWM